MRVAANRVCNTRQSAAGNGISHNQAMKKDVPTRPENAKAISRWESEGGARKSASEEERDAREAVPEEKGRLNRPKNNRRKPK
jgi:hypothetical protein